MSKHSLLFFTIVMCIAFSHISKAQFHEEKCIYGNCKNGYGVLAIKGNNDKNKPLPFHTISILSNDPSTYYYYYMVGEFKGKKLNGKGYRMEIPGSFNDQGTHKWLANIVKNNLIDSITKYCTWFEKGTYQEGVLNGKGTQIVPKAFITEGDFVNGEPVGPTYKLSANKDGFFEVMMDAVTHKYDLVTGRQYYGILKNNYCTNCKIIEVGKNGKGTVIANRIHQQFMSGWVVKDYTQNEYSNKIENVVPYKALYVANLELFKLPSTEQLANVKEVKLESGAVYLGEVDKEGRPYGFGRMPLYANSNWIYEGFVDNGKPEGWGIIKLENDPNEELNPIIGGYFVNGIITSGAIFKPVNTNEKVIIKFQGLADKSKIIYDENFKDIRNGTFTKLTYSYDAKNKRWWNSRTENGEKVDGYEKNVWVSKGKTEAEKRKQRTVTNGFISITDLTVGDIVVLNGMASPVVSAAATVFFLKNKKSVSAQSALQVQLSKHKESAFYVVCTKCNGTSQETYMYQRPPAEVQTVFTRYETEVLDYTVWRKTITETKTYTKTFAPEKRVRICSLCNGKGSTHDVNEIAE